MELVLTMALIGRIHLMNEPDTKPFLFFHTVISNLQQHKDIKTKLCFFPITPIERSTPGDKLALVNIKEQPHPDGGPGVEGSPH